MDRFSGRSENEKKHDEYLFMFGLLMICCQLGLINAEVGSFFVAAGIISFSKNLFLHIKNWRIYEIVPVFFLITLSIWFCMVVWKGDYIHPLFLERLATEERLHIDTLFHISIAQMIKAYSIPSTGLNGLPFINYHFGDHYVFACISKTLNIHVFTFYQLAYPAIFIPLLLKTVTGIPIVWMERNPAFRKNSLAFWFWAILAGGFIGVFPIFRTLTKACMEIPAVLSSESHNLSIIYVFSLINIVLFNYRYETNRHNLSVSSVVASVLIIFLLGDTKIQLYSL